MCETSFSLGLQERMQRLQELTDFTESCQADLKGLFEALGWSQELDSHAFQMEVCPYDPNHTVPQDRMEKHKASCQLSKMGYSKEEQAEMFDPSVYYEKANIPSVNMDKDTFHQVILQTPENAPHMKSTGLHTPSDASTDLPDVPQNHKRALCDLTVADRLAIYDHVIQQASQQSAKRESNEDLYVDLVAKLKKDEEQSGPKSHLEVLAEMRDYRRRRQSYRVKNVHITKKSYTEVIREVIDIHSGELGRIWQEVKDEEFKASQRSSHRGASERGHSASVESRVSSRDEHGYKRRRKHSHSRKRSRERKNKSSRDSHSPDVERHHKKKKKKNKS
ncbi:U11/U12 small nuclear ribonucleoprotein 48 kDa protein-like isoform X1 [Sinocyclocheilus rhinocerous]|uniref:U11/U12 small nuclear ribonucleoprotein 48 kDa protein-like isoform X1 n=1 Tax=Sinocyclocheilus rhinocerous TaxID=307959 RepID=UPI0007B7FCDA|nr:PREDICTED: U11/U12 small nuclear ribonucleoprotein 48 kDa protein-like isoform X1 [Sinocyclocheilus rhinocerous]